MQTRILMTASALFLYALGLVAMFLPQEMLAIIGAAVDAGSVLVLQLAGAVYFGFAMLNWAARGTMIGGIYSRPVSIGNFFHFAIGAITLLKQTSATPAWPVIILMIGYAVFAIWFGRIVFGPPPVAGPGPGRG